MPLPVTETCEKESPHLITHVATTAATTTDEAMTETIHAELEQTDLTPSQHLLDSGYITAPILVSSQRQYGIEVIGPGRPDVKWQANTEQGIDVSQFRLDWDQNLRPVRKGIRVSVGRRPSTIARTRSSRSSSPPQIAAAVLS
jgi:hypothetical protein